MLMSGADAGAPLEGTEPGWTWIRAARAQGGGRDATGTRLGSAIGEPEQRAFHGRCDPPHPPAFAAATCPAPSKSKAGRRREMQGSCSCQALPQRSVLRDWPWALRERASSPSHGPSPALCAAGLALGPMGGGFLPLPRPFPSSTPRPRPRPPGPRLLLRFPSLSLSRSVEGPGLGWWPQGRGAW